MIGAKDLEFSYKDKTVIKSVNIEVCKGQILSLVGPNGAGKSTLLKCMNGLLKPTKGIVEIDGKYIEKYSSVELARSVSYVPQAEPAAFPITVFDAILLGRRPYLNWYPKQSDLNIVTDVIKRMGLEKLAMQDINKLSGGERQKVIIAKAIVQEPKILLFDEPSTYLDLKYQLTMMQFIRELVDEKKICAIITTHDLNLALMFSDQLAVLKDGRIFAAGAPSILTEDVVREVYEVQSHIHTQDNKAFVVPLKAM